MTLNEEFKELRRVLIILFKEFAKTFKIPYACHELEKRLKELNDKTNSTSKN